jgi:hypothetical protein
LLLSATVLLFGAPSALHAEATVSVTVKDKDGQPADGKVTLTGADGKEVGHCTTDKGRCEIGGVPGGMHTVTVAPEKGAAPKPRKVMIPPTGKVALVVSSQ